MISHVWSVLCSGSSIDQDTNNLSLFDTIEMIGVSPEAEFPVVFPLPFQLVSLWSRTELNTPAKGYSQLKVVNPSGKLGHVSQGEVDMTEFRRLRQRISIQGFEITELGKYLFVVEFRYEDGEYEAVAQVPLEVSVVEPVETT